MTTEELEKLQEDMWEYLDNGRIAHCQEKGTLAKAQVEDILNTIRTDEFLCKLCGVGFGFGRVGLEIYQDELYPGTGVQFLFCLSQNHLDPKDYPWTARATLGAPHEEAFELFSMALEDTMVERWKRLGVTPHTRMEDFTY